MPELSYRSSYPVRVLQCITLGGDCTAQSHARTPLPMALTGSDSSRHYPYAGTSLTALASLIALVPFLVPSHLCAFRQQELTGPRRRPFRETCSSRARQSWVRAPHPMMSVVPSHHALLPPPPPHPPAQKGMVALVAIALLWSSEEAAATSRASKASAPSTPATLRALVPLFILASTPPARPLALAGAGAYGCWTLWLLRANGHDCSPVSRPDATT